MLIDPDDINANLNEEEELDVKVEGQGNCAKVTRSKTAWEKGECHLEEGSQEKRKGNWTLVVNQPGKVMKAIKNKADKKKKYIKKKKKKHKNEKHV